jgi:hypothetical protein
VKEIPPSDNVCLYFLWSRSSFELKLGNGLRAELLEADFDRSIDFPNTFRLGRGGSILDDKCIPHPASFDTAAQLLRWKLSDGPVAGIVHDRL